MRFLVEQEKFISQLDDLCKQKVWPEWKLNLHITPNNAERLAQELIIWARKTDAVRATTAYADFGVPEASFKRWAIQFPELGEAWDEVKKIFAEKRERGALEGRYNASIVLATLPLYDKEYMEHRINMATLKANEKSGSGQTVVNVSMDKMPKTDIVPEKVAIDKGYGGTSNDDDE